MEELIIDRRVKEKTSSSKFIEANTKKVTLSHLQNDNIIPVFSKDNECTISHPEFIECAQEAILSAFPNHYIDAPNIRTSHIVSGRIPSAIGKPVKELLPHDKTMYYERMAFMIEIPEIQHNVNGNMLNLTVGGVRAYNHENLYAKKSLERFRVFIGFKNQVCTNLCISTDGFKEELRASSIAELYDQMMDLFLSYNHEKHLGNLERMSKFQFNSEQMAHIIGKLKLYQYLSKEEKNGIFPVSFNDGHINNISKEYFSNKHHGMKDDGMIDLWRFYNLVTNSIKSSYIDSFLTRGSQAYAFTQNLADSLQNETDNYFLLPSYE